MAVTPLPLAFRQDYGTSTCINIIIIPDIGLRDEDCVLTLEILQSTVPQLAKQSANVYVFEHKIRLKDSSSWSTFFNQSRSLIHRLRQFDLSNPTFFVCERLGGFILKKALFDSSRDSTSRQILNLVSGICFLGTPHTFEPNEQARKRFKGILRRDLLRVPKTLFYTEQLNDLYCIAQNFERYVLPTLRVHILSIFEDRSTKLRKTLTKKTSIIDSEFVETRAHDEQLIRSTTDIEQILRSGYGHPEWCTCCGTRREIASTISSILEEFVRIKKDVASSSQPPEEKPLQPPSAPSPNVANTTLNVALPRSNLSPGALSPQSLISTTGTSVSTLSSFEIVARPRSAELRAHVPCFVVGSYTDNEEFFRRDEQLNLIDEALLPKNQVNSSEHDLKTYVVAGFAGVGKTDLVVRYAYSRKTKFDAVFFITADTEDQLKGGFCQISGELGLQTFEAAAKDPTESLARVKAWLKCPLKVSGRLNDGSTTSLNTNANGTSRLINEELASWLIIFDNADHPSRILDYWPTNGKGSVLVTSRAQKARSKQFFGTTGVELGPLSIPDATAFLKQLIQHGYGLEGDSDLGIASDIAVRLEGMPFSIVQAVGTMNHQGISMRDFQETYLDGAKLCKFFNLEVEGILQRRYKHSSIASAWALKDLKDESKALLNVLALFNPDCIQERMFTGVIETEFEARYPTSKDKYRENLGELLQVSQIERDPHGKVLRMHRIVRDFTIARMETSTEEFALAFDRAVFLISAAWPFASGLGVGKGHEKERWSQCLFLFTHIKHLSEVLRDHRGILGNDCSKVSFAKLLSEGAWYQYQLSNPSEAYPMLEAGLQLCQNSTEDVHKLTSDMYGTRTNLSLDQSDSKVCFDYARTWLDLEEDRFIQTSKYTTLLAAANNAMGIAMARKSLFKEANKYFIRSMEVRERLDNFKPSHNFSPFLGLGITAWLQGDNPEAETILLQALNDRDHEFGKDDRSSGRRGNLLYALGNVALSRGDLTASLQYHRDALSLYADVFGHAHRLTANAKYKVAWIYLRLGLLPNAKTLLDQATTVYQGRRDLKPHYARCIYQSSQFPKKTGDSKETARLLGEALVAYCEALPDVEVHVDGLEEAIFDEAVPYDAK